MSATPQGQDAWRVYDRADLQATLGAEHGEARELTLTLDGMHCASCASRVEKLLGGRVEQLRLNVAAKTATFRWRQKRQPLSALLAALDSAGFGPRVLAGDADADAEQSRRRRGVARIGLAAICAMQVMMLAWPGYFGIVPAPSINTLMRIGQWLLATPCVLWAGAPFFANAWRALRVGELDMDVPVALSLAAAYGFSSLRVLLGYGELYFDTATMFVAILLIGRHLEQSTRAVANRRLRLLAGARPLTAKRRGGDGVETVPIQQLMPGDEIWVPGGETLPADGQLLDEAAELDESLLSGESRPVLHRRGDTVLAGSLYVGAAPLRFTATAVGARTRLAAITALLDRGQTLGLKSARIQRYAERLTRHFVFAVLLLAGLGAVVGARHGTDAALSIALAVLVASCPCALSLAVPAALAAASSRLAAAGVLVADARSLMRLPQLTTVLFDKTGTLTRSQLRLQRVDTLSELRSEDCLAIAGALEQGSAHPIARAFEGCGAGVQVEDLRYQAGVGVSGQIDGCTYQLGATSNTASETADTVVELRRDGEPLARFVLSAETRDDAAALIAALQSRGLRTELLSGDAEAATAALARTLRVDAYRARQTPADKLDRLQTLQREGAVVLAVGDGLNDAPFLAAADVSAALPQGAALTQSRAGLILVGERLESLNEAIDIAAQTTRRMRENFTWAIVYNLAVLPLAISGELRPWIAALGMSLSSLIVVGNALRLSRHRTAPAGIPLTAPNYRVASSES